MGPKKYTLDELREVLDEKLCEFKEELLSEIKNDIMKEVKNLLKEKDDKIEQLDSTVHMLQQQVSNLKQMCTKINDLEQYGRRQCLRIDGVPYDKKEDSDAVLLKVKDLVKEAEVNIPDSCLDRAHRIGKPYFDKDRTKHQSIIVRFSTFRHRTLLYRGRKKIKNNVKIKLDLTKNNYSLLNKARGLLEDRDDFKYAFADVNCRLKLRSSNDEEHVFENIDDLNDILGINPR